MEASDVVEIFYKVQRTYNFGFSLKDEQVSAITAVINRRNFFGILPTGYGKSMCFVLPPLILDEIEWTVRHVAIVVSPLKSLMADQVKDLQKMRVSAIAVEPDMKKDDIEGVKDGKFSVMFISPESAISKFWRSLFLSDELQSKICLIACDEAHCISEWGDDFRPTYKEVISIRSLLEVPVMAVTATCDTKMRTDIFKCLALHDDDTLTLVVLPDRPNIYLEFRPSKQNHERELNWLVNHLCMMTTSSEKIIIYCRTVSATAELYNHVKDQLILKGTSTGIIDMFHRSIDSDSTVRIIECFKSPDSVIRCLFSTIAFGMGIQVPDVKLVIHWGVPKSLLTYWQEVGRAGRDGSDAYGVCYAFGRSMMKHQTEESIINVAKKSLRNDACIRLQVLQRMAATEVGTVELPKSACDGWCVDSKFQKCHKHPERVIEAFCSDHNVQCCLACVTLEHRKCEDVGTVEVAAENLRHSNVLQTLEKDLSVIDKRLKDLANDKEGNICELKTTSISIKTEIEDVRTRINSHLDRIQNETLNELLKIEQIIIPGIELERDEIGCQQSVVSWGLTILKTGLNYASDVQLLDEIAKIKDAKVKLEGFLSNARRSRVQIQFEKSKEIIEIESRVEVFGRVSTCEFASKDVLTMDPLKGSALKILEFKTSINSFFTGGLILQDDKFLIAQYSAKALEMYDPNGNLLSELSFDGRPLSVEMTEETSGVVTIFEKRLLVFFNITDESRLVETKRVSFEKYCYDVRYLEEKLYMANDSEIKILDKNGAIMGKICPLSSQVSFLDIDLHGRTLCYSSDANHIKCTGIDNTEIFTYKSDQLSGSTSMTRDSDFAGNVYIAGCRSGYIHQLDKRGRFNQIIVSGLSDTYALRFKKNSNKFITNSDGTAIVYGIV